MTTSMGKLKKSYAERQGKKPIRNNFIELVFDLIRSRYE
jgi:hypothetical protein